MHTRGAFRLGDLYVDPQAGRICGPAGEEQIDPKVMAVFEQLAQRAGMVVTREELLARVWEGRVVTDDVLSRCIYQLRKHLIGAGGHRSHRRLIRTLPKRGYLLEGRVEFDIEKAVPGVADSGVPEVTTRRQGWHSRIGLAIFGIALLVLALVLGQRSETRSTPGPHASGEDRPVLAVLPFADLSPAGNHGWFADGISEEIIMRLAEYPELQVIGRTSSFALRDSDLGSRELSSLLGASYLLEGSVRTDAQGVRVSVRLINADGIRLWSEDIDRQAFEVMALQQEIADVTASYIVPALVRHSPDDGLPDFAAYREYLLGKDLLARRPAGFGAKAAQHFSQAISLDPGFAGPYAGRAVALYFDAQFRQRPETQLTLAWQDVELALQLDAQLAEGYAAKALLMEKREPYKLQQREALLRRALELDPSLPNAWNWLAGVLLEMGQHEASTLALRKGAKADPLNPAILANLSTLAARSGRMDEALDYFRRVQILPQISPMVARNGVALLQSSGALQEAWEAARRFLIKSVAATGNLSWSYLLADVYAQLQWPEQAQLWLDRSLRGWPDSQLSAKLTVIYRIRHLLGYSAAQQHMQVLMAAAHVTMRDLPEDDRVAYGELLALAGQHQDAVETLQEIVANASGIGIEPRATLALAWSWQQLGNDAAADDLLQGLESRLLEIERSGLLHWSDELAEAALAALMLGDRPLALDRLRRAVDAGWRRPEVLQQDPRWAAASGPELQELYALMQDDIDRQRQEIQALEDPGVFLAEVDSLLAAANTTAFD